MKILMVGDIVGSPGRRVFAKVVAAMRQEGNADFVVANAENSAGGKGLTGSLAEELFAAGADVLTMGDHTWDQKDLIAYLGSEKKVVRPANFPPGCPGSGIVTVDNGLGPITVINMVGRVFLAPNDCPFRTIDVLLADPLLGKTVLVDFHAEATSEKIVMGRYVDGRVSCLVGTHTHVQTSDEAILPKGTAYLTDLGMTGPKDSAIGRDLDSIINRFLTGLPSKFVVAKDNCVLEGVVVDIDRETGKARGIERVRRVE